MAIDFPNTPTNGTTYDYLGITYTYVDSGGGLGYWKVISAGAVGVATAVEVNTGSDNVKYITPRALKDSKYGTLDTIVGFHKAGKVQVTTGGDVGGLQGLSLASQPHMPSNFLLENTKYPVL